MSKKGGKSGKGKGQGKKGKQPGAKQPALVDDATKQFFVWQINILEEKVIRYQKQNDELIVASNNFQDKLDQCIADKNDIINFYKNQLDAKINAYNDINDKFLTLKQILENEQEHCRKQMAHIRREADETQSLIVAENMSLNSKLASLEEFRIQKDQMTAKLESLEEELANKNEEYNEIIASMEQKLVFDRERLKAEMISRIKKVAAEFRRVTEKTLNTTIKRTLNENVMVSAQLAKMSDKTVELIEENDRQSANTIKLEQKINLLESNEKLLTKRFQKGLKLLNTLKHECKEQQDLIETLQAKLRSYEDMNTDVEELKSRIDILNKELKRQSEMNEGLTQQNLRFRLSSLVDTDSRTEMEQLFANAVDAIKESVMMMDSDTDSTEDYSARAVDYKLLKQNMLESLVVLLKSSAALGIRPFTQQTEDKTPLPKKTISFIPGAKHNWTSKNVRPHYLKGDLGLIPGPLDQIPTALDKMKKISRSVEYSKYRSILLKTYGTQTECTPISLLYTGHLFGQESIHQATSKQEMKKPIMESGSNIKPKRFFSNF
ncbi:cilia- and flagella-associated protein 157 [Biomphalaria glabrata]|nr:cilia- and flagella-associated protein 157 [Biomphalaria glabrata]